MPVETNGDLLAKTGAWAALIDTEGWPKIPLGCRIVAAGCCNQLSRVVKELDDTPTVEVAGGVKL